ncbi:hypothetical protein NDU88_009877 [Pleurodeles waltl]|uniref:Uncharacterized protein n=1 Tax=Pleurodeles waltl TaxID=8319 RepID=A0AAV7PTB9_PLEWA|nr:hypothetical protein NDU88_009877 [Pleurodeles waltl]
MLKRGLPGTLVNTGDRAAKRRKTTRRPTKTYTEEHLRGPLTGATRPSNPWSAETILDRRSTVRGPLIRATRPSSVQGGRIVNKATHRQPSLPWPKSNQRTHLPGPLRRKDAAQPLNAGELRTPVHSEPGTRKGQKAPKTEPPRPGDQHLTCSGPRTITDAARFVGNNACSKRSAHPGSRELEDRRERPRQRGSFVIALVICTAQLSPGPTARGHTRWLLSINSGAHFTIKTSVLQNAAGLQSARIHTRQ